MLWEQIKFMLLVLPLLPSMLLAQTMGTDTGMGGGGSDTGAMNGGNGGGFSGGGGMEGDGAAGAAGGGISAWGWFWIVVIALAVVLLVWMFAQSGRRRGQPGT